MGTSHYQVVVILEGVVEIGDPAAVTKHQHVPLLVETSRLSPGEEEALSFVNIESNVDLFLNRHTGKEVSRTVNSAYAYILV
ncbi:hypothetical protein E2C01_008053 [Portunus trituberculatus]|uniref:Uncharacterized protein n=1 Tax=Portunus trituberculatus TaxID=210409 RepID=A0A5B7CZS4_PORTR|nr:hypothetical protein [Portunus trituberculatus]